MAEITHLPGTSNVTDIIDVVERDGAVIVDDFVSQAFLADFNSAVQTSVDDYTPYDYGEEEANEFLGYQTVRLNGIVGIAPCYIDLITDERLLSVMDYFLKPNCGQYRLNSSEIIEIHGGETAQELHVDDMIWPVFNWAPDRLLQFQRDGRRYGFYRRERRDTGCPGKPQMGRRSVARGQTGRKSRARR